MVCALVAAAGLFFTRGGAHSAHVAVSPDASLDTVGSIGVPIQPATGDLRSLARLSRLGEHDFKQIRLIASSAGRNFYRLHDAKGAPCYAVGDSAPSAHRLAAIACAPDFPSPEQPMLDFTVLQRHANGDVVVRAEGLAADGVAEVALIDEEGKALSEAPVVDNAFAFPKIAGSSVRGLVAYDTAGRALEGRSLVGPASP